MSNSKESDVMSKRQFVRTCLCGLGYCFLELGPAASVADFAARNSGGDPSTSDLWKWSKEALFYRKTENGLQCEKCPHGCLLGLNEAGICRNRINSGGKLYTIAYGNPCAVHIDPIEKKPLFHFLPSTTAYSIAAAGCNLRCLNCQNWQISQFSPKETENYDMMPAAVVGNCLSSHCESIAYTYSEPTTFYEYAIDTAQLARAQGIKNVWKSSGYINEVPLRKLCRYLDAANIDLKVFDDGVYRKLNGASLDPVLKTLTVFKQEGVWLEITNLVIPTWTDKPDTISRMCEWLNRNGLADCPLHFSRFTPLYKLNQLPSTPVSTLEQARDIALKAGIQYVYIGNVPGHMAENTFCPRCRKMIVERKGFTIAHNFIENNTCTFCGAPIPGVWQKA
jgi:pyruvate formate lyase activating enzyme